VTSFGLLGSLRFAVPGIRNTRAKSDNRSKAQPRCDARRRSRVCQRVTSAAVSCRSSAPSKTYGSLKSHQAWAPLPVAITTVGGMHSGMMEIASAMVAGSAFVCASDFKIEVGPETANAGDIVRHAAVRRPAISSRQAHSHVHVQAARFEHELRSGGDVAVPVGASIVQRPDQDVQLLRLELPEEIEKGERRHSAQLVEAGISWRLPRLGKDPNHASTSDGRYRTDDPILM